MRVVILGAGGLLGRACKAELAKNHDVRAFKRAQADITDRERLRAIISDGVDWVVNCAAMTDVDACEVWPYDAYKYNAFAPGLIARECRHAGVKLLHVSTDYVFNGQLGYPYHEYDDPSPINIYGKSKLAGENEVRISGAEHIIARTQWLYGEGGSGFVDYVMMCAKRKETINAAVDLYGSPTYSRSVAENFATLIERDVIGIFHVSCMGVTSRYEMAAAILEKLGSEVQLNRVFAAQLQRKAQRPQMSALISVRAPMYAVPRLESWQAALNRYFKEAPCV
jgi:dTDP-4-dehydrorhamnose reductase